MRLQCFYACVKGVINIFFQLRMKSSITLGSRTKSKFNVSHLKHKKHNLILFLHFANFDNIGL